MKPEEFARQVGAWIPPAAIVAAAIRYEREPASALQVREAVLTSAIVRRANEAALRPLVERFLSNFRLSPDVLELLPTLYGSQFRPETLPWLRDLRFHGSVVPSRSFATDSGQTGLLVISERDAVLDMLIPPLNMLVESISMLATTWKDMRKLDVGGYLQHRSNGPLAVYLESRVATAYKYDSGKAGVLPPQPTVMIRYRAVTLLLPRAPDPRIIPPAKESARHQGRETLNPL